MEDNDSKKYCEQYLELKSKREECKDYSEKCYGCPFDMARWRPTYMNLGSKESKLKTMSQVFPILK